MRVVLGTLCLCAVLSGCDETAASKVVAPTPTPTALLLSFSGGVNPEGELPIEGTVQFNAFVRMSDGGGESVTARVSSWQSANTNVATVSSSGLVRGVGPGLTAITAEYEGLSGTLNLLLGR